MIQALFGSSAVGTTSGGKCGNALVWEARRESLQYTSGLQCLQIPARLPAPPPAEIFI